MKNVTILKSYLSGTILPPPSKSYSHRYIIASMLANNLSNISNIVFSEDVLATLNALPFFNKNYEMNGKSILIYPQKNDLFPIIDANESGSTLRFLIPIFLTKYDEVIFKGSERLLSRGVKIYEELFKKLNISFNYQEKSLRIKGKLKAGNFIIDGSISSQYISGLLFALPLLKEDSTIQINPPFYSKNYVDMTLNVLKQFHINILQNENMYIIKGQQKYIACNCEIEGDYSNAAFLDAFNYFNHSIHLLSLNPFSLQGDKIYQSYFNILNQENATIDLANCIDLGPILIAFAALKNGATFIHTNKLKIKECDRGEAMKEELAKIGSNIEILEDQIIVYKSSLHAPNKPFLSHNDHRIVMALTLISSLYDIQILNASAINKSYPNFFKDIQLLGGKVYEYNE